MPSCVFSAEFETELNTSMVHKTIFISFKVNLYAITEQTLYRTFRLVVAHSCVGKKLLGNWCEKSRTNFEHT